MPENRLGPLKFGFVPQVCLFQRPDHPSNLGGAVELAHGPFRQALFDDSCLKDSGFVPLNAPIQ
jgi:hypothetical protein